ncbi:hypothetical protein EYZ11_008432 [Aspergillus tanneri]|nr:hypothetical protein EYZ11_008432 [Aspergillus tanneri]
MDGLLAEIKTVKHDRKGVLLSSAPEEPLVANSEGETGPKADLNEDQPSADYILTVLRSKPDGTELSRVLAILDPFNKRTSSPKFDVRIPGPTTAQILKALVSITIPDHWNSIDSGSWRSDSSNTKARAALLRCLSSVAGISCLITQLRSLIASSRSSKDSGNQRHIRDLLAVISALLEPRDFALRLHTNIEALYSNSTQKQIVWRELLSLIAASRVLSTAAEALTLLGDISGVNAISWVGEGPRYASWIGINICHMASKISPDNQEHWKAVASLTGRALSLGYTDKVVGQVYSGLLIQQDFHTQYTSLFDNLRPTEQLKVIEAVFCDVEKKHFSIDLSREERGHGSDQVVKGVAALCSIILPNTQVILLAAGYLQRLDPGAVKSIGRSGIFLSTVSNRLAASSSRPRFFGMIIGTAISRLIEEPGKAMRFDLDEMDGDEARWYLNLIESQDAIGSLKSIQFPQEPTSKPQKTPAKDLSLASTANRKQPSQKRIKIMSIEEIDEPENDQSEDEDEDLIPYEKPDEDPSDSDEDPTLVQRNRPTAPVYIRDLVIYLRDRENIERYELAITTAPSLIRRKTGFGTELAEHTEELALILVGLQEQSKLPKFQEYQVQSMIALIVSQPLKLGRWFAAMFFDGDLSQFQRSAILTALGLSAREIAGNGEEDARTIGLPALPDTSFPSKKLPASVESLYVSHTESPIATLTQKLSQASLEPLAANAADAVSGPNALKVRTFSSRMEVEKKRQQRESQRQKSTINDLHKVLSDGFFYPLKGRFEILMIHFSSSTARSHNPFVVPHLLCLFIQTLALILSTMGPHTPSLPSLTQETLSFLLSLHMRPIADDPAVLSAFLALFLTIIDLNIESGTSGEERLVTEFASQVIELRDWAGQVFDRTAAAHTQGDDARDRVKTLAAGVMVKLGDVMERYQGRLMGVGSGFKY